MGICTSGTIRDGRIEKLPLRPIDAMKKEQRGSSDFRFTDDGKVLVVRWKDNNVVTVGFNFDTNDIETCKRYPRARCDTDTTSRHRRR